MDDTLEGFSQDVPEVSPAESPQPCDGTSECSSEGGGSVNQDGCDATTSAAETTTSKLATTSAKQKTTRSGPVRARYLDHLGRRIPTEKPGAAASSTTSSSTSVVKRTGNTTRTRTTPQGKTTVSSSKQGNGSNTKDTDQADSKKLRPARKSISVASRFMQTSTPTTRSAPSTSTTSTSSASVSTSARRTLGSVITRTTSASRAAQVTRVSTTTSRPGSANARSTRLSGESRASSENNNSNNSSATPTTHASKASTQTRPSSAAAAIAAAKSRAPASESRSTPSSLLNRGVRPRPASVNAVNSRVSSRVGSLAASRAGAKTSTPSSRMSVGSSESGTSSRSTSTTKENLRPNMNGSSTPHSEILKGSASASSLSSPGPLGDALCLLDEAYRFRYARVELEHSPQFAKEENALLDKWKRVQHLKQQIHQMQMEKDRLLQEKQAADQIKLFANKDLSWMQYAVRDIAQALARSDTLVRVRTHDGQPATADGMDPHERTNMLSSELAL